MMNWIDVIIILVFIYYIIDGYRRGFVELIFEFVAFIISTLLALNFNIAAGAKIAKLLGLSNINAGALGFLAVWFGSQVVLTVIIHLCCRFIPATLRNSRTNRMGGILPSFAKGLMLIAILLYVIISLPISGTLKKNITNSKIGSKIVTKSAVLDIAFKKVFGDSLENTVGFITIKPPVQNQIIKPDETLMLGFTTQDVEVDNKAENRMLSLVNEERQRRGLKILSAESELQKVARLHAIDMFKKGYFSHVNLDGKSPFDRMREAGIIYKVAGENLALAPNVDLAHTGLMNSPGHRANILEAKFGRAGIGVVCGGAYGCMFVQEFRD